MTTASHAAVPFIVHLANRARRCFFVYWHYLSLNPQIMHQLNILDGLCNMN
jgi:hypothetical protein